jgi:hypothetical protein
MAGDDNNRSEWLCIRAVLWVLDDAPDLPPSLVATLVGIARHANDSGRDSYPSQGALARYARKTPRQVKKDIAGLLELGLIRRPDDQSAAVGIRADRRPVVYDLAFAPMRPYEGNHTTGRQVPQGTTRHVAEGRTGGTTGTHGGNHSSPEEDSKKTEKPSPRARVADVIARACPDAGEEEIQILMEELTGEAKTSLIGYVTSLAANGELTDRLAHVRSERQSIEIADALERARADPQMRCEHGTDAGRYIRPGTGLSATCLICRNASSRQEKETVTSNA